MPNLRSIIDGTTIAAGAPVSKKPSPVAQHVSETVQDPFGKTKEGFSDLTQKKLEYEVAKDEMTRQLAPVQSILDHVGNVHELGQTPNGQPGNADNPEVDEDGNPIDTGQMGPGQGGPMQQMNQQRPSLVGHKPGVVSGPQQSVVPKKLGQAAPGGKKAQNSPQPKGSGNKPASKPAAKGGKTGHEVKVNVTAGAAPGVGLMPGARNRLSTQFGLGTLKCGMGTMSKAGSGSNVNRMFSDKAHKKGCMCANCSKMNAGGPGSGRRKGYGDGGGDRSNLNNPNRLGRQKIQESPKQYGPGPSTKTTSQMIDENHLKGSGRSKGAKKGWSTRGKGHLSKTEKAAHYQNMT